MDECKNCTERGDIQGCLSAQCNQHESWFAKHLMRDLGAKQTEIDSLMLEYCPDEMTVERMDEWSRNQRSVERDWI